MAKDSNWGTCRSCKAQIYWVITEPGGKKMPIDAEPDPTGSFVVTKRGDVLVAQHVKRVDPELLATMKRYMSHWATCPDSDDWHKRTGAR